jgi:calcineurin-like phosphoesterase family protein
MSLFKAFYSDPHFGHERICELSHRPFESIEEMNETLIKNYNEVIDIHDICLWLGDAFLCNQEEAKPIMRRLHGYKVLLTGGHDKGSSWMVKAGFDLVSDADYLTFKIAGRIARACHYPYWEKGDRHNMEQKPLYPLKRKGEVLVHGHSHLKHRLHGNQIHVGVDAWDFKPVLWEQVEELARKI